MKSKQWIAPSEPEAQRKVIEEAKEVIRAAAQIEKQEELEGFMPWEPEMNVPNLNEQ